METYVRLTVEVVAAVSMPVGVWFIIRERLIRKRGVGARTIQFTSLILLIPTILILALEKVLESNIVGTLLGALSGYVLSGIANYEPRKNAARGTGEGADSADS